MSDVTDFSNLFGDSPKITKRKTTRKRKTQDKDISTVGKRLSKSKSPKFKSTVFYIPKDIYAELANFGNHVSLECGLRVDASDLAILAISDFLEKHNAKDDNSAIQTRVVQEIDIKYGE